MKRKGEWFEWMIPKEWEGIPLQELIKTKIKAPKGLVHQWRQHNGVKVNRKKPYWVLPLYTNDRLSIHLFPKEDYGVIPVYRKVDVLYEDDHIIILNKPAGVNTHPNKENETNTLANALAFYYQVNGISTKTRHVHRLDQDTTGAVVFAKHSLAHAILDQELKERSLKRTYVAIVHGKLTRKSGVIKAAIGKDRHHPNKRRVSKNGKYAVTHYEVLKYSPKLNVSAVRLTLDTGRTHQIRVHLSYIGHPIIGDKLYGGQPLLISRQALHANRVTLKHPITNQIIDVTAPFPKDMKKVLDKI
ncbi:23S rRNA pseudouridine1911/1915/1917 synthase [Bacillus alveayuensis]|uniref:Pseudouridine synthase n=1 Tax=Aeribacillus alveayuensis TaxID=279215 RepID=A0ABT9VPK4_9BACI|nr:23S rRNA pseudouridine1911/1915/1917 synthase [Bacillus alveayuensis]